MNHRFNDNDDEWLPPKRIRKNKKRFEPDPEKSKKGRPPKKLPKKPSIYDDYEDDDLEYL